MGMKFGATYPTLDLGTDPDVLRRWALGLEAVGFDEIFIPEHDVGSYCWSTDYPHIEGGKDIKRKFLKMLAPMGEDVLQKFFRRNSELLLPSLATIRAQPLVR
jgi:hypothetical protein